MRRRTFIGLLSLLFTAVAVAPDVAVGEANGRELVVVVNRDNPVTNITLHDLRDLYLGKRRFWSNGMRVHVADLVEKKVADDKTAFARFTREFIDKDPVALKSFWIKMIFSGSGQPPKQFETPEEVIHYVADDEGGVAYLYADQVSDAVKVIAVSRPDE